MPDQIPVDERTTLLVAMAELKGQVAQALNQYTALDSARSDHEIRLRAMEGTLRPDHEPRLRAVEDEQATWRGRAAVTGVLSGGGMSIVVALVVWAINTFGG